MARSKRRKQALHVLLCCLYILDALWDHPGAFNVTGPNSTAGIFATYPGKHLTIVNGFFDQVDSLYMEKAREHCP